MFAVDVRFKNGFQPSSFCAAGVSFGVSTGTSSACACASRLTVNDNDSVESRTTNRMAQGCRVFRARSHAVRSYFLGSTTPSARLYAGAFLPNTEIDVTTSGKTLSSLPRYQLPASPSTATSTTQRRHGVLLSANGSSSARFAPGGSLASSVIAAPNVTLIR